ncbi:uncharacterized protein LOC133718014 [Rosa rugosa]|uniref:uncharacterized protein LOC133718014 n=1 Tax=Rosa rugosa TaxID=74645 RepID=UPI002B40B501|nr:uncharacterized protein LOC133718014 [Rosa rugosa]
MGNCFVLCRISTASRIVSEDVAPKQGKVVKVLKMDGKVLEFRAPILVKNVLLSFSGSAGIGVSKQLASEHLPANYELKLGKFYYMVPLLGSVTKNNRTASATTRRIKIVITRQQLQELLTNQVSVQKLLSFSGPEIKPCNLVDPSTNWKPKLQVIPEGSEH